MKKKKVELQELPSCIKVKNRTAVVLIHGIGEQRPTSTLREFLNGIKDEKIHFWEKPDGHSGNYETRKMTMDLVEGHSHMHDFYEFYWAHHMRDTRFSHISDWVKRVIFRVPSAVSNRLRKAYWTIWGSAFAFWGILGIFIWKTDWFSFLKLIGYISSTLVLSYPIGKISSLLFNYLGDAARYMDPKPSNVSERRNIREEGLALLRRLHDSGEYKNIILIGHSLGSVIAYDLIKFLWIEYYKTYQNEAIARYFRSTKDHQKLRIDRLKKSVGNLKSSENVQEFTNAQAEAFLHLSGIGNGWLISDFISIGSPLTHVEQLLVPKGSDFTELKKQKVFPVCPPINYPKNFDFIQNSKEIEIGNGLLSEVRINSSKRVVQYFSHSSPFSVTRWKNYYFSSDYIGGPLSHLFGMGIQDQEMKLEKKWLIPFLPGGHTRYWDQKYGKACIEYLKEDLIWFISKQERGIKPES